MSGVLHLLPFNIGLASSLLDFVPQKNISLNPTVRFGEDLRLDMDGEREGFLRRTQAYSGRPWRSLRRSSMRRLLVVRLRRRRVCSKRISVSLGSISRRMMM